MSKRDLGSSMDSDRDVIVADVGEGSRVECGLGEGPGSCGCRRGTSGRVWTRGKAQDFLLAPTMGQPGMSSLLSACDDPDAVEHVSQS